MMIRMKEMKEMAEMKILKAVDVDFRIKIRLIEEINKT